jgi:hypothetical protein
MFPGGGICETEERPIEEFLKANIYHSIRHRGRNPCGKKEKKLTLKNPFVPELLASFHSFYSADFLSVVYVTSFRIKAICSKVLGNMFIYSQGERENEV